MCDAVDSGFRRPDVTSGYEYVHVGRIGDSDLAFQLEQFGFGASAFRSDLDRGRAGQERHSAVGVVDGCRDGQSGEHAGERDGENDLRRPLG